MGTLSILIPVSTAAQHTMPGSELYGETTSPGGGCQMGKIPYASSPGQDRRPDAPDALQVSAVSEDSAQMTWDDRGYSQCYEVRMYADAGYQTITQTLSRKAREYVTLNDLKVGETR